MGRYCPVLQAAEVSEGESEGKLVASICLACKRPTCYYDEERLPAPGKRRLEHTKRMERTGELVDRGAKLPVVMATLGVSGRTASRYIKKYKNRRATIDKETP